MAEVTGPISTLPGATYAVPEGVMCDFHPDRPATTRIQGETDSFGSEMHDVCKECAQEHRAELRNRTGNCEWCEAKDVPVTDARDYEEGMSGRVYSVCKACKARQDRRLEAEEQRDHDYWDDDNPEDDCDHEHYDRDILTGIARCEVCGHRWTQTPEEIERERQAQVAWDKHCEEMEKQNSEASG